jgi:hypothetical protein
MGNQTDRIMAALKARDAAKVGPSSLTLKQRRGEKIQWTERARQRHTAIDSPSALKSLMGRVMHDQKHGNKVWKGGRRQAIAVGLALQSRRRAKGAAERVARAAAAPQVRALSGGGHASGMGPVAVAPVARNRREAALKAWVTRRGGAGGGGMVRPGHASGMGPVRRAKVVGSGGTVRSLGKKGGPVFAPRMPASPPARKAAGPRWASLR